MRREIYLRKSRKSVVRRFPLFTGYIFVAQPMRRDGSLAQMPWDVLGACDGIGSVLGNDGWALVVPNGYVERMQAAQIAGLFDKMIEPVVKGRARKKTAAERFPAGTAVRPKEGPFAGFNGLVEDVTAQGLIKVAIEIFGRGTPVEFEAKQLEAL
ncbi:hypothetical protein C3941_19700 [Kaistia algarum]|nr:hypothetical protein [Kaistia algarum]PPE78290.1 hypothetical protein C3941_19700 [Kaistia algarum]